MLKELKARIQKFKGIQFKYAVLIVVIIIGFAFTVNFYKFAFTTNKYNYVLSDQKGNLKKVKATYDSLYKQAIRSETIEQNEQIAVENLELIQKVESTITTQKAYMDTTKYRNVENQQHADISPLTEYIRVLKEYFETLKISGERGIDRMIKIVDEKYEKVKRYIR